MSIRFVAAVALGLAAISPALAAEPLPDPSRLIKVITASDSYILLSDWQRARRALGQRYAECSLLYDMLSTAPVDDEGAAKAASQVFFDVAKGMLFELDKYEFKAVLLTASQDLERAHDQSDDTALRQIGDGCKEMLTDVGARQAWLAAQLSVR